jgi:hypothetical protein
MSPFEKARVEYQTYLDAMIEMYRIEGLMLQSDFGRCNPLRAHELARRAVGIPDDVLRLGSIPLAELQDEDDQRPPVQLFS